MNLPGAGQAYRWRGLLIVLIICASAVALFFAIAAPLSWFLGHSYLESVRGLLVATMTPFLLLALGIRLGELRRRGSLVCDCGPHSRAKLYRWLAIASLLLAIVNLEATRRIAELAPVDARVRQNLTEEIQVLLQTKVHLTEQKQLLSRVQPNPADQARLSELLQQDRAEQTRLSELVKHDRAEQTRLSTRLLPDGEALRDAMRQLGAGITGLATQPWNVLSSAVCFQLYLSIFMLSSAISLFLLTGRNQIREHGLWQNGNFFRWKSIDSYRWVDGSALAVTVGKRPVSPPLQVPPERKPLVADLLSKRLGPASASADAPTAGV